MQFDLQQYILYNVQAQRSFPAQFLLIPKFCLCSQSREPFKERFACYYFEPKYETRNRDECTLERDKRLTRCIFGINGS